MSNSTVSENAVVIERIFDAPVERVWQMWAEPEHFKHWYGPQGFSVSVTRMEVQAGGKRLLCMEGKTPDGDMKMWLTGEYLEIVPKQRLIYTESMSDEQGNILPLPDNSYPAPSRITVLLEDLGGRTKMVMTHSELPEGSEGAREGWEEAVNRMAAQLEAR